MSKQELKMAAPVFADDILGPFGVVFSKNFLQSRTTYKLRIKLEMMEPLTTFLKYTHQTECEHNRTFALQSFDLYTNSRIYFKVQTST